MQEVFMDCLVKSKESRSPSLNWIVRRRMISAIALVLMGFTLLFSASLWVKDIDIRILYINDFHGFAQGYNLPGTNEQRGNIACLAALTEKLRMRKHSLLVASGDMIQGDNWANFFQGKSVIDLMNQMHFDAMSVGNH